MRLLLLLQEDLTSDSVTVEDWLQAALIFGAALLLGAGLRELTRRAIKRVDSELFAADFVGGLVGFVIGALGLLYALAALEVRLTPLLGALGIGGLALAFALQDIIENFAAGLILQIRRPLHIGDEIRSGEIEGAVLQLNLRSVIVHTFDGERAHLPNSTVLKEPIINFTARGSRRSTIMVGVSYDADLRHTRTVILTALKAVEGVEDTPAPEVQVDELAASWVNVAVRFWHKPQMRIALKVRDEASISIIEALQREDIELPSPQVAVWMRNGQAPGDRP